MVKHILFHQPDFSTIAVRYRSGTSAVMLILDTGELGSDHGSRNCLWINQRGRTLDLDFPVRQGKYREYSQFRPVRVSPMRKNSSDYEGFMS
jgi:hypothetical protein